MPDFRFSFLSQKDLPKLHSTFLNAFSDYLVPIQLSWEQFQDKVKREGIEPSFCAAAYVGEEMVGFILTGVGEWHGRPTAYNAGTGVVAQYRGHRLTQQLYGFMIPKLRESGIEQCLLEVITENVPAIKAYQSVGFKITRALDCFRGLKPELLLQVEEPENITVAPAAQLDWKTYQCLWDVEPTWQNSKQAVQRSGGLAQTLEARNIHQEIVGYISFFSKNGAVAQLAVDEQWRGRGIGTALLREAVGRTEAPALMFINIENTAQSMISFLERRYLKLILKQYEMLLPIA